MLRKKTDPAHNSALGKDKEKRQLRNAVLLFALFEFIAIAIFIYHTLR